MITSDISYCIDDSISHVNGIAPFIGFGVSSTSVVYVDATVSGGNRGNYVCDFAKVESAVCGETESYVEDVVINGGVIGNEARLRYSTVLRKYNFIKSMLRGGYYGKVAMKTEEEFVSMDCSGQTGGSCVDGSVTTVSGMSIYVTSNFDDLVDPYEFIPMDASLFSTYNSVAMEYTGPEDDIPNELVDGAFVVLLNNYGKVMEYDADWDEWWVRWFGQGWETQILDANYITPAMYKFVRDFETYVIGKVVVPSKIVVDGETFPISGVSVPSEVYYLDLEAMKHWYSVNNVPNKTGRLKKFWDDHGGDAFYAWLNSVEVKYISEPESITGTTTRFLYVPPYSPFQVSLTDKHTYEFMYDSYLVDEKPFEPDGVFSGYSRFNDSHFVEMTDSGMVESKLSEVMSPSVTTVNGIDGVWSEFSDSASPAVFMCVYHSNSSRTTGLTVTQRKNYIDGSFKESDVSQDSRDYIESAPNTVSGCDRVVLVSKNRFEIPNVVEIVPDSISERGLSAVTYTSAYTSFQYGWFECFRMDPMDVSSIVCADGEIVHAGSLVYRSVTMLEVIPRLVTDALNDGDVYYFSAKHDNGYDFGRTVRVIDYSNLGALKSFTIPFSEGSFRYMYQVGGTNVYAGNYIPQDGISVSGDQCTIQYVVGGKAVYDSSTSAFTEVPETGIRYIETHPYKRGCMERITIDGYDDIPFYYDVIDLSSTAQPAYIEELGLSRTANRAYITGMEVATVWTSGTAITAKLITRDYGSMFNNARIDVDDFEVDRGNASAFDGYFRLSECNTFEDIENYGNNRFQI